MEGDETWVEDDIAIIAPEARRVALIHHEGTYVRISIPNAGRSGAS
jgi:hypothetical protein